MRSPGTCGNQRPGGAGEDREERDRPEPGERDPDRALGGQLDRGLRRGERAAQRVRRSRRTADPDSAGDRDQPPAEAERGERVVAGRVDRHRRDHRQSGRLDRDEQDRAPEQVLELHQPASVTSSGRQAGRTGHRRDPLRRRSRPGPPASATPIFSARLQAPRGPEPVERPEGVEIGAIVAGVEGGRRVRPEQQRFGRGALVDADRRSQLQDLAAAMDDQLAPLGGRRRCPRPGLRPRARPAAPRQCRAMIGPLSSSRSPARSSSAGSSVPANTPAARARAPSSGAGRGSGAFGSSSSKPWLPM